MAKLTTIEIAAKQRHMFLLGKVKENKTLSRAELAELKRYERRMDGKITADKSMRTAIKSSTRSSNKRVKKKTGKKRPKKERPGHPSMRRRY